MNTALKQASARTCATRTTPHKVTSNCHVSPRPLVSAACPNFSFKSHDGRRFSQSAVGNCPSYASPSPAFVLQSVQRHFSSLSSSSPLSTTFEFKAESEQPTFESRTNWNDEVGSKEILVDTESSKPRLEFLAKLFKRNVAEAITSVSRSARANAAGDPSDAAAEQKPVILSDEEIRQHLPKFHLITAWLASDNVLLDLFQRSFGVLPNVIAVDTLYLFDETLEVADVVTKKYFPHNESLDVRPRVDWFRPQGCTTKEDFVQRYGPPSTMREEDFDYRSKVEPLQRALRSLPEGSIIITGRRSDQGSHRLEIPIWEPEKHTFNPLALWSWRDVSNYVIVNKVPVNKLHKRVCVDPFHKVIGSKDRDRYENFIEVELSKPYFSYKPEVLQKALGGSSDSNLYVWKSFGDVHTSVPVSLLDSERDGRFVKRRSTECGIHTRVSNSRRSPHGGAALVNQIPKSAEERAEIERIGEAAKIRINLTERQVCDLELLLNGGYTPLRGFMNKGEYDSCVSDMRLLEGCLWGLPVTLDTHDKSIRPGDVVALYAKEFGGLLAVMDVEDTWRPDKMKEAEYVMGTKSLDHPYVHHVVKEMGPIYLGGTVRGVRLPDRPWLPASRIATPEALRRDFKDSKELTGFQCRNPLHRAHIAMFIDDSPKGDAFRTSNREERGDVIVHPAIGPSKDDDFDAAIRVPTYEILRPYLRDRHIHVHYFPYQMRLAGPREAIQHMICRKNYGFTKIIIGRDHAGCKDSKGVDFYDPYAAQQLALEHTGEIGLQPVAFQALSYSPSAAAYLTREEAQKRNVKIENISGTEFRRRINNGIPIPEWYSFPDVVTLLEASYRFHLAADRGVAERVAEITKKNVVLATVPPADDDQFLNLEAYTNLSRKYPAVPFFVTNSGSRPSLEIVSLTSSSPADTASPLSTQYQRSQHSFATKEIGRLEDLELWLEGEAKGQTPERERAYENEPLRSQRAESAQA